MTLERQHQEEVDSLRARVVDLEKRLGQIEVESQNLARAEERFRYICSATRDLIYDWSVGSDLIWFSDSSGNFFGEPGEHSRSLQWWEHCLNPTDRARVVHSLNQAIAGTTNYWTEDYRFCLHDGTDAYIQDRGFIVRDNDGRALRMIGMMADVTERSISQREVLRLASFPNENPNPIVEADAEGRIQFMNPSCRQLINTRGIAIENLLPPNHSALVSEALRRNEVLIQESCGNGCFITWSYHPVVTQGLVHIYGKDTTIERQRERLLLETETKNEAILQAIPDLIFRLTRGGKYLDVRGTDFNGLVRPRDQLLGSNLKDITEEPEFVEMALRLIAEALDTGTPQANEYALNTISGNRGEFEARIIPLNKDEVLWIARDITRRKEAERLTLALKDLGERLGAASTSKQAAETIAETAKSILGWDCFLVSFYNETLDQMVPLLMLDTVDNELKEYTSEYERLFKPGKISRKVLTGESILIRDRDDDPGDLALAIGATERQSKSLMFVPIRGTGKRIVGLLSIQSYTRKAYTQGSLETLQILADFCSSAMSRTRAQDALLQSERRYRRTIQHSGAVLYEFNYAANDWSYIDPGIEELTGYAPNEINTQFFGSLVKDVRLYGDVRSFTVEQAVEEFRARKNLDWKADYLITAKDGTERWIADSAVGILDENGELTASLGMLQDITERKNAERLTEALRDLGENLNQASSSREVAEIISRAADQLIGWDAFLLSFYRESDDKIQYILSMDLVDGVRREFPGDYQALKSPSPLFMKVLREGPLLINEEDREDPSLGRSSFGNSGAKAKSLMYVPVKARQGSYIGVVTIQSYTKNYYTKKSLQTLEVLAEYCSSAILRANAQDALRESEARFRFLVDHMPAILWTTDRNLRITSVAGAARTNFRIDGPEAIGRQLQEVIGGTESGSEGLQQHVAALQGTPQIYDSTFGGRILQCHVEPVYNERNEITGLIGIGNDVTELREAEAEHRRLDTRIQHSQKLESLGVLAGGIAHDFNNLLSGILGNAGLALMELPQDSPARSIVEAIEKAACRAADLTRQMLAYSGRGKFLVEDIDLNELVREMTQLLQVSISKKAVLRQNLADYPVTMRGDISQVHQILMNLITNASDAIGSGSGVVTISTGTMRATKDYLEQTYLYEGIEAGDYCFVDVADTGCGMDAATLGRIFDPFFTTKFTGRGLGLAATLGIIRGHKGTIKVDSQPGVGTTFRVLFPCAEWTGAQRVLPVRPEPPALAGTVLVIDDEETVVSVIRRTLERVGVKVLTASDGMKGLEQLKAHLGEVSAVLLDMTMPGMSGEETFLEIHALAPSLPVILMSGYNEQDAVSRFRMQSLAGFLHKPFRPQELTEKLRGALADR